MRRVITATLLMLIIFFNAAFAQRVSLSRGQDVDVSQSTRKELMKQLKSKIEENYFDRGGVEELNSFLKKLEKSKEYGALAKTQALSRYLTLALRDFTKDPHFNVIYSPPMYKQAQSFERSTAGPGSNRPAADPGNDPDKRKNFFMPKLEVLEGNIGYLKIDRMANIQNAKKTVDAAMEFLAHTDAMILDLRGNGGGIGGFTPYIASYFFPSEKKLLFSREFPAYDSVSRFYTVEHLEAPRKVNQNLYVLVDGFTGSAARNLAYTLQQHGRAQLVGEASGLGSAGAHSAGLFALVEGFIATVPIANVVHPVSKSNWSMVGVVPDHKAPSVEALEEAHLIALNTLWQKAAGDLKAELGAILEKRKELPAVQESVVPARDLKIYAGAYELRKVTVENGKLYLQRDGGPKLELKWIEKDLFQLTLPPNATSTQVLPKVRFDRGEGSEITQLAFVTKEGKVESIAKRLK